MLQNITQMNLKTNHCNKCLPIGLYCLLNLLYNRPFCNIEIRPLMTSDKLRTMLCTGKLTDPQLHFRIEITEEDINNMTKTLLNESLEDCSQFGLSPFCTLNNPPVISF